MLAVSGSISLYISTFSLQPDRDSSIRQAGSKFIEDVTPYLTPLIVDALGGYNIRAVSRRQNGASIPTKYTILTRRPVKTILKPTYGSRKLSFPSFDKKPPSNAVYAWFDGYISKDRDLEKLKTSLQAIDNAGLSLVSIGTTNDMQVNVKIYGENPKEMEELNQRLLEVGVAKPRLFYVVGYSILETEIGEPVKS